MFHGVPVFLWIAIRQDKDDRRQGPPSSESHLLRVLDDLFKSESYWNAWSNQPVHSMWLQKLPYNYCDKLIRSHGVNSLVIVKWKPEKWVAPHSDANHIAWFLIDFADYPTCTCEWLNLRWWKVPGQSMQSQKKKKLGQSLKTQYRSNLHSHYWVLRGRATWGSLQNVSCTHDLGCVAPEGVVTLSRLGTPEFTGLVKGPSGNFVTANFKSLDFRIKVSHIAWYTGLRLDVLARG